MSRMVAVDIAARYAFISRNFIQFVSKRQFKGFFTVITCLTPTRSHLSLGLFILKVNLSYIQFYEDSGVVGGILSGMNYSSV